VPRTRAATRHSSRLRRAPLGSAAVLTALLAIVSTRLPARCAVRPGLIVSKPSPHEALQLAGKQMDALKQGNVAFCFEHSAPKTQAAIGSAAGLERIMRESPALSPLIGLSRWQLLGSLHLSEDLYVVRVRVMPAYASSAPFAAARVAPIDYTWYFRLRAKPDGHLSWMVDEIVPDLDAPPL